MGQSSGFYGFLRLQLRTLVLVIPSAPDTSRRLQPLFISAFFDLVQSFPFLKIFFLIIWNKYTYEHLPYIFDNVNVWWPWWPVNSINVPGFIKLPNTSWCVYWPIILCQVRHISNIQLNWRHNVGLEYFFVVFTFLNSNYFNNINPLGKTMQKNIIDPLFFVAVDVMVMCYDNCM